MKITIQEMTMQFYRILIGIALMLALTIGACAQEADDDNIIYIDSSINERQNPDTERGSSVQTPDFHFAVEALVEAAGYDVVFLSPYSNRPDSYPEFYALETIDSNLYYPTTPTISAALDTFGEHDALSLTPYSRFVFDPLPEGSQSIPLIFSMDSDQAVEIAPQLTAGVALYAAQDCEAALPLLDATVDSLETHEDTVSRNGLVWNGVHFYRGNCLHRIGDLEGAVAAYELALTDPTILEELAEQPITIFGDATRTNLAYVQVELGELDAALDTLAVNRELASFSSYRLPEVTRYSRRAEVYALAGDPDAALAEMAFLLEALEEAETDLPYLVDRIDGLVPFALTERGRLIFEYELASMDEAMVDFSRAIAAYPAYPLAYYWRGVLAAEAGDDAAAEEDFNMFIELSEDFFYDYALLRDRDTYLEVARAFIGE